MLHNPAAMKKDVPQEKYFATCPEFRTGAARCLGRNDTMTFAGGHLDIWPEDSD